MDTGPLCAVKPGGRARVVGLQGGLRNVPWWLGGG